MSNAQQQFAEHDAPTRVWLRLLLATVAVIGAVGIGLVALEKGKAELLVLLIGAAIAGYASLTRPQIAIYLAIFLLYTNAPVIAKRFHGIPYPIVFSIPLLLLIPIAHRALFRGQQVFFPRLTVWIVLFLIVQTVGALMSKEPGVAFSGVVISVTEGALLFILIVNAVRTEETLRGVVWVLLAAGAFLGAVSAHQYLTSSYSRDYGGFGQLEGEGFRVQGERSKVLQNRAAGPLGVKNRYAQIMLLLFPLGLFQFSGERQPAAKYLALAATGLIMIGWALAFSRGSAVGFALTVMVMVGLGYLSLQRFLIVAAIAGALLLALPQYRTRLASLDEASRLVTGRATAATMQDGAATGRVTEMLAATRVYMDHPIVGVGPTMFRHYAQDYCNVGGLRALETEREAHCLYVAVAAEFGTLGLIAFFGAIYVTLRDLSRLRRVSADSHPQLSRLAAGFFFMIVVYLTTGIFAHFSFVRYFWMMMALATACVCIGTRVLEQDAAAEGTLSCNPNIC